MIRHPWRPDWRACLDHVAFRLLEPPRRPRLNSLSTTAIPPRQHRALAGAAALALVALAVHALVLRFVFPGYYDPLWPHHSDFYFAANFAQSGLTPLELLRWPRPIGMVFLQASGLLGIRGSIAVTIAVFALNCALTAVVLRRWLGDPFDGRFLAAYAAYVFMVAAHAHFYAIYTHDMLSQVSYCLLVGAAHFLLRYLEDGRLRFAATCGALALAGFLAKETYALPAVAVASALALGRRRQAAGRRALAGLALLVAAFALALLVNKLNGSPFTTGADHPGAPYRIDLGFASVLNELRRYAAESFNAASLGSVFLTAALLAALDGGRNARTRIALVLPCAGVLAWVGNAALPNHYLAGYSWNGMYLVHAPLLALAPHLGRGPRALAVAGLVAAAAVAAPILHGPAYRANGWYLEQEARQRALLQTLSRLGSQLPPEADGSRILVTGIDFPFSPFQSGLSLRSLPNLGSAHFDVLRYPLAPPPPAAQQVVPTAPNVRLVAAASVDLSGYDYIWVFRSDGTLAASLRGREVHLAAAAGAPFSALELIAHPRLLELASAARAGPQVYGTKALECGADFLARNELDKAQWCLRAAVERLPANPYPYFYLGALEEKRGDLAAARDLFERAVQLDDPSGPNAYFREALARARAASSRK